jgi:SAM-dependent methyltransferase
MSAEATYFERQRRTCRDAILPFIASARAVEAGMRVMEIGCGEGGVLREFVDRGCVCVGIERSERRMESARRLLAEPEKRGKVSLITSDVYDVVRDAAYRESFDVIILKDVIEHIHDQERLMATLGELLVPGGVLFFGFPPWTMPFGGHQQVCESFLSKTPYVHLLPRTTYERLLRAFGEPEGRIEHLLEIVDTGISTRRFEAIVSRIGFHVLARRMYLLSPNYESRFGLKPIVQLRAVTALPRLRDFATTAAYYLVGREAG